MHQNKILRFVKHANVKSYSTVLCLKCGYQVPRNYGEAMELENFMVAPDGVMLLRLRWGILTNMTHLRTLVNMPRIQWDTIIYGYVYCMMLIMTDIKVRFSV